MTHGSTVQWSASSHLFAIGPPWHDHHHKYTHTERRGKAGERERERGGAHKIKMNTVFFVQNLTLFYDAVVVTLKSIPAGVAVKR